MLLESSIDDTWNVDGGWELPGLRTGFTQFSTFNEKPANGYTWSGVEIDKSSGNVKARLFVARSVVKDYVEEVSKQRGTDLNY